ncbi:MAG: ATP-binding protein [Breznakibacter sp.]
MANNDEKELRIRELESLYNYKKTHDSEDFDFLIEENAIPSGTNRRDKLNNVLQAYFAYRIDNLKNGQSMAEIPSPIENSNIWIDENKRLTSTFFIKYHNKHNYQINIPRKLRVMEELIIDNKAKFGRLDVTLNNNPTAIEAKAIVFKELHLLNKLVPEKLKNYRILFFETIKNSTQDSKGIFEVCDIFNFIDIARNYITEYFIWLEELKRRINTVEDISVEEKIELQNLYTEIQNVDSIHIKTTLPDQQILDAILLNPLHPLRLIWFIQLYDQFSTWESATIEFAGHLEEWTKNLEPLFDGILSPENNPLILYSIDSSKGYQYAGEITYGWALYVRPPKQNGGQDTLTSVSRQVKTYLQNILNINKEIFLDSDISLNLVIRHIRNYIKQHPYTNKIIINLFNAGDAYVFANSLVELEKLGDGKGISYEVRLFKGKQSFIINGEALKNLINPEYNVSEEAEAFSQPVINRLFPKLRFSINSIDEYIENPEKYASHLSFLINPFPIRSELMKVHAKNKNFYLNGLITTPTVYVEENEKEIRWKRFIFPNHLSLPVNDFADKGVQFFGTFQSFIAGALSTQSTESVPSTELILSEKDKVLISLLHDNSDWVITFDRNLGPQIFDQPSKDGHIPFLLDYIPGEEVSGVSSYLTTRPTSEILGLLSPHFEEFGLNYKEKEDEEKIKILLEDLRAISSSLVMQLNTSKNKAFEVIGAAFTKRVLEKKKFLENAFLIPIDLHQYLFENLPTDNKSRADNLLVSFDIENRSIVFTVIEVKCRKSIAESEKIELKDKMKKQIENTISALKLHFDPYLNLSHDRLDRQIKNKELKSLLEFYVNRASRYKYLDDQVYQKYLEFLQTLDSGFQLVFKQLGLIYDFSTPVRHKKDVIDSELTYFTFGSKLIDEILDPESDLNTRRLENEELESDLRTQIGAPANLSDFLKSIGNLEVYEQPEIEKIIEEPKSEPITQPKEIVATKTEIIKNPEAEITKEKGTEIFPPRFDVLIGKSGESPQYGLLGKTIHGKTLAIDLSETNTISLFGVQGGGKSYSIGIVAEMVMKQVSNVNILPSPLASVIFHYSESMDYEPEFTSMILPNDQESEIEKLKKEYGANPESISDIVILTPKDKVSERQSRYPSIPILPIAFNSSELNVQDWMFLLGAVGNDSTYIKQLKAIMKENRNQLSIENLLRSIEDSVLLSNTQKALARQRLSFAQEYIDDSFNLKTVLKPGRLVLVDLRDEFVEKDQALGLFVIMLNIFSSVNGAHDNHFNKFIVFDEAHKYMDNKELTGSIVTAIREMRHKGVSIMIASQDPPSLPNEIIELSSIVLVHKFNSPQWLKHIQKSITQLDSLSPADMSALQPGEGFIWSTKANDKTITTRPVKIYTRPRFTKHGGGTIRAI